MRAHLLTSLFFVACVGAPATQAPIEPAPAVPQFDLAWHAEGGSYVASAEPGSVLSSRGLEAAVGEVCGQGRLVPALGALLFLPGAAPQEAPKPPAVAAVVVEAAGWRLDDVLGPAQGIQPGGAAVADPARHKGIRVRSVRKTRRKGAPVQVVVGDRAGQLALLLTDKGAREVLASAIAPIDAPLPEGTRVSVSTASDLDGDGQYEVVVGATRPDGTQLRQVFHLSLEAPMLVSLGMAATHGVVRCAP